MQIILHLCKCASITSEILIFKEGISSRYRGVASTAIRLKKKLFLHYSNFSCLSVQENKKWKAGKKGLTA
jgi:hypothetical protein